MEYREIQIRLSLVAVGNFLDENGKSVQINGYYCSDIKCGLDAYIITQLLVNGQELK